MSVTETTALDGRAARWTAHRTARRAELVRAARHAVHELGPDVSMEDLAAHAGTSKPILYRYFADKAGLQVAVGQAVLSRMQRALEEAAAGAVGPRERIAAMVAVYLEMVDASPHVSAFVTRDAAAGEVRGFVAEVTELVVDALLPALTAGERTAPTTEPLSDAGPNEAHLDTESRTAVRLWAAGVVGLVRGAVDQWLGGRVDDADRAGDGAGAHHAIGREALAAYLSSWLWDSAAGVLRRVRAAQGTAGENQNGRTR